VELAFFIAYNIRIGDFSEHHNMNYTYMNLLVVLTHLVAVFWMEGYSGIMRRGILDELKRVLLQNTVVFTVLLTFLFFTKQSTLYSRIVIALFYAIDTIIMFICRIIWRKILFSRASYLNDQKHVIVITEEASAEKILDNLQRIRYATFRIDGLIILDKNMVGQSICDVPVVATKDKMFEYTRDHVVDEVYIKTHRSVAAKIADEFLTMGVKVHVSLERYIADLPNTVVERIGDAAVVTSSINVMSFKQRFVKRTFDIIVSVFGLIVTGIFVIIFGPIIYIQSPGPIFFKQKRVGQNGRTFYMYKFRSMYMDAEERKKELMAQNEMSGFMFKMENDPRIIPIGHFIRKMSIDEFPQFWNILKGDMSLVGTRPPTLDEVNEYEAHHLSRLAIKPGLTGMWQVSGRSDITDFEEVVRLDKEYIQNFSLSLDLKILWRTIGVVLGMKGSK
jgi:exopolysaccharide biosynthesis polyprenyl glycosylphosphotransferase